MENPGKKHFDPRVHESSQHYIKVIFRRVASPPPMATPHIDVTQQGLLYNDGLDPGNRDGTSRVDATKAPPMAGGATSLPVPATNGELTQDRSMNLRQHMAGAPETQVPGEVRQKAKQISFGQPDPQQCSMEDMAKEQNRAATERRIQHQKTVGGGASENPAWESAQDRITQRMQQRRNRPPHLRQARHRASEEHDFFETPHRHPGYQACLGCFDRDMDSEHPQHQVHQPDSRDMRKHPYEPIEDLPPGVRLAAAPQPLTDGAWSRRAHPLFRMAETHEGPIGIPVQAVTPSGLRLRVFHDIEPYPGESEPLLHWFARDDLGRVVGHLWADKETGQIMNVETPAEHRRQGVATTLYNAASAQRKIYHSPSEHRTAEGDAWALAVGGDVIPDELAYRPDASDSYEDEEDEEMDKTNPRIARFGSLMSLARFVELYRTGALSDEELEQIRQQNEEARRWLDEEAERAGEGYRYEREFYRQNPGAREFEQQTPYQNPLIREHPEAQTARGRTQPQQHVVSDDDSEYSHVFSIPEMYNHDVPIELHINHEGWEDRDGLGMRPHYRYRWVYNGVPVSESDAWGPVRGQPDMHGMARTISNFASYDADRLDDDPEAEDEENRDLRQHVGTPYHNFLSQEGERLGMAGIEPDEERQQGDMGPRLIRGPQHVASLRKQRYAAKMDRLAADSIEDLLKAPAYGEPLITAHGGRVYRDESGIWRHSDTHDPVPGARDMDLNWAYPHFVVTGQKPNQVVLVPHQLVRDNDDLSWVREVSSGPTNNYDHQLRRTGRPTPGWSNVWPVPVSEWDFRNANSVLGMVVDGWDPRENPDIPRSKTAAQVPHDDRPHHPLVDRVIHHMQGLPDVSRGHPLHQGSQGHLAQPW